MPRRVVPGRVALPLALAWVALASGCTVPAATPTATAPLFEIGVQDNEYDMLALVCTDAPVTHLTVRVQQPGEWDDEWVELADEADPEPRFGPHTFVIGPPELLWEGDRLVVQVETADGSSVLELTVPKYRIPSDGWLFSTGEASACPDGTSE